MHSIMYTIHHVFDPFYFLTAYSCLPIDYHCFDNISLDIIIFLIKLQNNYYFYTHLTPIVSYVLYFKVIQYYYIQVILIF